MVNLILTLTAFSILLLISVGVQNTFAGGFEEGDPRLVLIGHDGFTNKHILIDIDTGEAIDLGLTTFDSRASGLATTRAPVDTATSPTDATITTHPAGTIFGVYRDATDDKNYVIWVDTTTGKANKIVEVVGGILPRGVAFGPDGGFFANEAPTKTLYTIDMITGVKTPVGGIGSMVFSTNNLQFDLGSEPARFLGLDTLRSGAGDRIISISPTTGLGTQIDSLMDSGGSPVSIDGCALVKHPDDGRWFTVARDLNPLHLFEIDVATGLVTDIGDLNQNAEVALNNVCGLTFAEISAESPAKIEICHIPPGNNNNARTLSISSNAVPAHLAHGDTLGPCP